MDCLSPELLFYIIHFVDLKDIYNVMLVNKYWNEQGKLFWRKTFDKFKSMNHYSNVERFNHYKKMICLSEGKIQHQIILRFLHIDKQYYILRRIVLEIFIPNQYLKYWKVFKLDPMIILQYQSKLNEAVYLSILSHYFKYLHKNKSITKLLYKHIELLSFENLEKWFFTARPNESKRDIRNRFHTAMLYISDKQYRQFLKTRDKKWYINWRYSAKYVPLCEKCNNIFEVCKCQD